jgi:2-polyprenyl-3-methyl-5-hydroxy-6-metoxy-1,4-benzoquinol methylase
MEQKSFTKHLYEDHHKNRRAEDFSILKEDRGALFSTFIGERKKILDIGCRDGALTEKFLSNNDVLGVDIDANALARASRKGIKVCEMDLYGNWEELGGQKFDAVVAGEVLEHLFNPEIIVKQIKDYLSEDGMFVGSIPNAFSLRNRFRYLMGSKINSPLADPTHINHFSYKELRGLLSRHFAFVDIVGLGRYRILASIWPNFFAFDLAFRASDKKYE